MLNTKGGNIQPPFLLMGNGDHVPLVAVGVQPNLANEKQVFKLLKLT